MNNSIEIVQVLNYTIERHDVARVDRIPDVELGRLLGYADPLTVREIISRSIESGDLPDVHHRRAVRRWEIQPNQWVERPIVEYALTEDEALFIAARSETPAGAAVLKTLIKVFIEAREGRAPAGLSAADLQALAVQVAGLIGRGPGRPRRALAAGQAGLFDSSVQERAADPWEGACKAFLASCPASDEISTFALAEMALGIPRHKLDRAGQVRIGFILRGAGWAYCAKRSLKNEGRVRAYRRAQQGEA